MSEEPTKWIAVVASGVIVALQHCCGVNDAPVNCYIDSRGNWECPNCMTTYGAPVAIAPRDVSLMEVFQEPLS